MYALCHKVLNFILTLYELVVVALKSSSLLRHCCFFLHSLFLPSSRHLMWGWVGPTLSWLLRKIEICFLEFENNSKKDGGNFVVAVLHRLGQRFAG